MSRIVAVKLNCLDVILKGEKPAIIVLTREDRGYTLDAIRGNYTPAAYAGVVAAWLSDWSVRKDPALHQI